MIEDEETLLIGRVGCVFVGWRSASGREVNALGAV
jgi:hypothetical protein